MHNTMKLFYGSLLSLGLFSCNGRLEQNHFTAGATGLEAQNVTEYEDGHIVIDNLTDDGYNAPEKLILYPLDSADYKNATSIATLSVLQKRSDKEGVELDVGDNFTMVKERLPLVTLEALFRKHNPAALNANCVSGMKLYLKSYEWK